MKEKRMKEFGMSIRPFGVGSGAAVAVILLLGFWSGSCAGMGGGLAAERPLLRLTGLLLDHSLRGDASQDFGAVKVRIVIRRYSTAEEVQEIRRLSEAGDEPGFQRAFGKVEVASVESPTTGALRQRCYVAVQQPSPQGVRIILISEGIVSPVMKMMSARITELVLNEANEGAGWVYRSRVQFTEGGDIVFERVSPGTPGQITNVRPLK